MKTFLTCNRVFLNQSNVFFQLRMHVDSLRYEILSYFGDFNFLSFLVIFLMTHIFRNFRKFEKRRYICVTSSQHHFKLCISVECSTSPPSGHQVDGLPLAISK